MIRYTTALVLSVFACAWVALFYRPTNTYLNKLLLTWLGEDFLQLRLEVQSVFPLSELLIYTVPGALWVFGGALLGWRLRLAFGRWKFHRLYQ
ncbi:MAG: hypothetical protein AAFQ37_01760 [Bacteroidota bacterium]